MARKHPVAEPYKPDDRPREILLRSGRLPDAATDGGTGYTSVRVEFHGAAESLDFESLLSSRVRIERRLDLTTRWGDEASIIWVSGQSAGIASVLVRRDSRLLVIHLRGSADYRKPLLVRLANSVEFSDPDTGPGPNTDGWTTINSGRLRARAPAGWTHVRPAIDREQPGEYIALHNPDSGAYAAYGNGVRMHVFQGSTDEVVASRHLWHAQRTATPSTTHRVTQSIDPFDMPGGQTAFRIEERWVPRDLLRKRLLALVGRGARPKVWISITYVIEFGDENVLIDSGRITTRRDAAREALDRVARSVQLPDPPPIAAAP